MAQSFLNKKGLPFGLRNNNPGNLRTGIPWKGIVSVNNGFCVFENIAWGIRAMATDMRTDIKKKGHNTIITLVNEYAPPNENNTTAYINAVVKFSGIAKDQKIVADRETLKKLVRAFMNVELGQKYSALITDADIYEGIDLMSK